VETDSRETPRQHAHHVSDSLIAIDLLVESEALRSGDAYSTADHAAHTISKQSGSRVVLIALKAGGRMNEHHADAPITVQGLQGTVNFTVGDQTIRLTPGVLVTAAAGMLHSVEAIEESAFLLTMGAIAPHPDVDPEHHG
jgi:quercetin dioxygenase-like cupin family protein